MSENSRVAKVLTESGVKEAVPSKPRDLQALREQKRQNAKKQLEDIKKQGDAIRDAVATPAERARKKLADLSRLYKLNAIDAATFARATAAAHKELFDSIEKEDPAQMRPGVGAAVRGTTAGFSAVQRGREAARTAVDQRKRLIREAEKRRRLL